MWMSISLLLGGAIPVAALCELQQSSMNDARFILNFLGTCRLHKMVSSISRLGSK
jgi:hypothetical protein